MANRSVEIKAYYFQRVPLCFEEFCFFLKKASEILEQFRSDIIVLPGKIIDANLIPSLVKYLMVDDNPLLQFEAAWAITNIASGTTEQTKAVVKSGAVEAFVHLLESDHMNVVEQAVWALGNIAGDGAPQRDRVTEAGAVPILIKLSTTVSNLPMLRNITWTISNLCRNKNPQPKVEVIQQLLPTLKLLLANDDRDIMTDACWALSYITDSSDDRIQLPLDHGILPRLVHLLHSNDPRITTPALRTVKCSSEFWD